MRFPVHPALRARVDSIDVIESQARVTVLPSSNAVLGFQFRGAVRAGAERLSPAGITGIQLRARDYSYEANTGSVLVRFTPQGATSLGVPGHELAGRSVPLESLIHPGRARALREQLIEAATAAERAALVERFLLELPFAADRLLDEALLLLGGAPAGSVAAVSRRLGLSERQLERRFLARVGLTPKQFSALRRFERAVSLAGSDRSLTDVALDAGYFDQSHFIREVRRLAGAAPGALLRGPADRAR